LPEDPATGGSPGFGFVSMEKDAATNAIDEVEGCELDGRIIRVNEAQLKTRQDRRSTRIMLKRLNIPEAVSCYKSPITGSWSK
jgi:RNA recognition motif-containing protein